MFLCFLGPIPQTSLLLSELWPCQPPRAERKSQILSVRRQQRAVLADPASRDIPPSRALQEMPEMSEVRPRSILALPSLSAPARAGEGTSAFSLAQVRSQAGVHKEPAIAHALLAPGFITPALTWLFLEESKPPEEPASEPADVVPAFDISWGCGQGHLLQTVELRKRKCLFPPRCFCVFPVASECLLPSSQRAAASLGPAGWNTEACRISPWRMPKSCRLGGCRGGLGKAEELWKKQAAGPRGA